jgi:hypothetical protein
MMKEESGDMPKLEIDKFYTVGEAIEIAMEKLSMSRAEAAELIWGGVNSGELTRTNNKDKS